MLRENVEQYIKGYCNQHGALIEPLHSIARKSGVSIATAHRALQDLERQRAVKIIPAKHRTKPNTILYVGQPNEPFCMDKLGDEFKHTVFKELVSHLTHKQKVIDQLRSEVDRLQCSVIGSIELPEAGLEIIVKRRDKNEPGAMERNRS